MIACRFLGRSTCTLPVVEQETVRGYCVRLMEATNQSSIEHNTCYYTIISEGKLINRADNRHRLLADVADLTKDFYATFASLATPSSMALVKGNMATDSFEPNLTTCAICLEDYMSNTGSYKGTFISLPCLHRFHMKCVASQRHASCAICSEPIDSGRMYLYKQYARTM